MKAILLRICIGSLVVSGLNTCSRYDSHQAMLSLLASVYQTVPKPNNSFSPMAKLFFVDSLLAVPQSTTSEIANRKYLKAQILMELGRENEAIALYEDLARTATPSQVDQVTSDLALAYLRKGERENCIAGHEAESCLMPIKGLGVHHIAGGSTKAIELYRQLLERHPEDIESKWLINIAYMTLGKYPAEVPAHLLIPGMAGDTTIKVNPFHDIAANIGIAVDNMAGGVIVDDFNNDGYLDVVTSSMDLEEFMHFFRNNGDGTFTDESTQSHLAEIHGGLNIVQADYDNDGFKDILVLRGGWKGSYGNEPNSLLRNLGDGTFKDVTTLSGMLSFHPTQTATWNDFNNDGWLDLFIGNETVRDFREQKHPCELYINNGDGTFREIAKTAGADRLAYVKGVTSGDYDNDGWTDLFLSTMDSYRVLLKNNGTTTGGDVTFTDVSIQAGIQKEKGQTFPTWFWDYDNDGWLDIFVCDYTFHRSLAYYAAAEKLNVEAGDPDKMILYHNNHDGTFTNVAREVGLNHVAFAMGSNFGDVNNDGFLDIYLGTGNPLYKSVIPNKMFKNIGGTTFADVTTSAAVGHLQKGHGVAFADLDHDGDQDIYIDVGGAYVGDSYQSAFFLNTGRPSNNWINIELIGTTSNRNAIGSRVKVSFREDGKQRSVYRDVNSGGSFGASPLRREIGVGKAQIIDDIEITWHGSAIIQHFKNVKPNQFIRIKEGIDDITPLPLKAFEWVIKDPLCLPGRLQQTNY